VHSENVPKRKETAKALTGGATGGASVPVVGQVWLGCVTGSCQEPARRDKHRRRLLSWSKATEAAARTPQGFTLGDAMGSVFTQLAQIEAEEAALQPTREDSLSGSTEEAQAKADEGKEGEELRSDGKVGLSKGDSLSGSTDGAQLKIKMKNKKAKNQKAKLEV